MTGKRKANFKGSASKEVKRQQIRPPPPSLASPPVSKTQISQINEEYELGPLLREKFASYEDYFQDIAKEFSVLRKDALHFAHLIIVNYFNSKKVELANAYIRNIAGIRRQVRRLDLDLRFAQELHHELDSLGRVFLNNVQNLQNVEQYPPWKGDWDLLSGQSNQLQQKFQNINHIIEGITMAVNRSEQVNDIIKARQDMLIEKDRDIVSLIIAAKKTVVNILFIIKQVKVEVEARLQERLRMLNSEERESMQDLQKIRNLKMLQKFDLRELLKLQDEQSYNNLTDEARLQQMQIKTKNKEQINSIREKLIFERPLDRKCRNILKATGLGRESMDADKLFRLMNSIENHFEQVLKQLDIVLKQIHLLHADSQTQGLPQITNPTFWNHLYRKVALDPNNLNANIHFLPHILSNFDEFDNSRKSQDSNTYKYQIPVLDPLHENLSIAYANTITQDVIKYLMNSKSWIICIFEGYFLVKQEQLQQRQEITLPIQILVSRAAEGILKHTPWYELLHQKPENEQEDDLIREELQNMSTFYHQVQLIYEAEFGNMDFDTVNDYEYAKSHPLQFIRLSVRLLQVAPSLARDTAKLWSLLPETTHSMMYVPLSGVSTLFTMFQKAHQRGLPVPDLLNTRGNFMQFNDFKNFYLKISNRLLLWNTIFNIDQLESGILTYPARIHFGEDFSTNGHMVCIPFEKTVTAPRTEADLMSQKKRVDFTNHSRNTESIGFVVNDDMIELDSGMMYYLITFILLVMIFISLLLINR